MERTIGIADTEREITRILQEVIADGENYVVESRGERVAAVVPIEVYDQWKEERAAFLAKIREIQQRANLSPDEAERIADEAVQAVRQASRQ